MAGHVMASVFHDTLQADVEQTQRVTQTINSLPPDIAAAAMPYKAIDVLAIAPTRSLDGLAQQFTSELPARRSATRWVRWACSRAAGARWPATCCSSRVSCNR
jgi:NTE family protein